MDLSKEQAEAIAKHIESKQSDMFATFDSIDDLVVNQKIKGEGVIHVLMAVNTTLQAVADGIRKLHK